MMTTTTLIAVLSGGGAALASAIFAYVPGLKDWFGRKPRQYKALFMAGLIVLVGLVSVAAGCRNMFASIATECSQGGLETLLTALFSIVVAGAGNQSFFMIGVRPFEASGEGAGA